MGRPLRSLFPPSELTHLMLAPHCHCGQPPVSTCETAMTRSLIRHLEHQIVDAAKAFYADRSDPSALFGAVERLFRAQAAEPAAIPVHRLVLSLRSQNILRTLKCETVADVASLKVDDLVSQKGCGAVTVSEIRKQILAHGFDFIDGAMLDD